MGIKSFNNPTSKYNAVWGQTGLGAVNPSPVPPDYVKASGGTETTYAPSATVKYQVHSFLTSSTFVVDTAPGENPTVPTTIDILVVGLICFYLRIKCKFWSLKPISPFNKSFFSGWISPCNFHCKLSY